MILEFDYKGKMCQYDDTTFVFKTEGDEVPDQSVFAKLTKEYRATLKHDKLKLNVGCGFRPFSDFINLDYDPLTYPDVLRNLDEGLPFDSDKFDEVYTSHVIEHIKDVFLFMYEIWRVSKKGARITIVCPNGHNLFSSLQPDHVRQISYDYFDRWKPEHRSVQNELKQTRGAYFNILSKEIFNEERELRFVLECVKYG